jgi:hypothetical protein
MAAWFKPRRYGYGAAPVTWQGWALVVGFVAAVFVLIWATIGFNSNARTTGDVVLYLVGAAVLVAGLVIISKRKTDGEWRWRWGDKEQERQ